MKYVVVLLLCASAYAGENPKKAPFIASCRSVAARIALKTGFARSPEAANAWAADECASEWMLADFHNEVNKWEDPKFQGCLSGVSVNFVPSDSPEFRKKALASNCL
jgi:hypothetical protein